MKEKLKIIPEIRRFVEKSKKSVLLINGAAGTGKTILTLELLGAYSKEIDAIYLSTRVDAPSLLSHFPWLSNSLGEKNIIDLTQTQTTRMDHYKSSILFDSVQEFTQNIYLLLEERGLEKPKIAAIDSVEALSEVVNEPTKALYRPMFDLAKNTNTLFILVSERERNPEAEYLSDGVITLKKENIENRYLRSLIIEKLRGTGIKNPIYYFTLKDAHFDYFESYPFTLPMLKIMEYHPPVNDTKGSAFYDHYMFSTGNQSFDKILGGYQKGSFVVFYSIGDVSWSNVLDIVGHTSENFLVQDGAVLLIPMAGFSPNFFHRQFAQLVGKKTFENNCVVLMPDVQTDESTLWLRQLSNKPGLAYEQILTEYTHLSENYSRVLVLIGFDTLETYFGPQQAEKIATKIISHIKLDQNIVFGLTCDDSQIQKKIKRNSDYLFTVFNREGKLFLYGVHPATNVINVTVDMTGPHPLTKYTEVL